MSRSETLRTTVAATGAALLLGACRGEAPAPRPDTLSPTARPEIAEMLRADLEAERHAWDGTGRAWIESSGDFGPLPVQAGGQGRWTVHFEAGPPGVAEGGLVFLQAPAFWGWSPVQTFEPEAPGYTTFSTEAEGVELRLEVLDQQLIGVAIEGRALRAGERITFVYGAGPAGARADTYAERRSAFHVGVDGDGDGVRALLPERLEVEVAPGEPARLLLTLPSTARPGETVRLTAAILDLRGNAGIPFAGQIALSGPDRGLEFPASILFEPGDRGRRTVEVRALEPGVYRLLGGDPDGLIGATNPLAVTEEEMRILWGDLHGHSGLSDGTGSPEEYFRYAREVAALDVVALTDHDHWGMEPIALHPELWERIREETRRFHEPGRFVTLLGYEWTSWVQGHRHVLYFADEGRVLSSVDREYETPDRLWAALRGEPALTFAHHSAGGPVATNWDFAPPPELEPVTEIVSVHGSSEAPDSPRPIYDPAPGNYVRDALGRGYRLGFIGSGDGHDGHPGLAGLSGASGGLAAILSEETTREGVLEALRARRVYATNGPRIVMRISLGGRRIGSTVPALETPGPPPADETPAPDELRAVILAVEPLARVDLVRSGQVVESWPGEDRLSIQLRHRLGPLRRGEHIYLRAVQIDDGAAWSSPFFVE